ncbi:MULTISPECIES: hypothetical protein [Niastella]|uniref:Uncharacterized protein n=1 Tax=Niastella soli TaxID=2821487 RepID=A0ABS3Z4M8_9BACT|nr:hypothetical protein [Niastella soli]MBO9205117.1 hypothetical protein [Niastella soli]
MKPINDLIHPSEQHIQTTNPLSRYSKPARLIEKATTNPEAVIKEVFAEITPGDLTDDLLPSWLHVAITASTYSENNGGEILTEFYEWLVLLVEALYIVSETSPQSQPTHLTADQQANPMEVINGFFQLFSIEYARRELCDFIDAGIGYDGNYPDGFSPWLAWMTYNHIICLVEAAFQLYFIHEIKDAHLLIINAVPVENLCG